MKYLLTILLSLFTVTLHAQSDTVKVRIDKRRTTSDGAIHVWYHAIGNDTTYYSVCKCDARKIPQEGDTSRVLRSQLVYIKGKIKYQ